MPYRNPQLSSPTYMLLRTDKRSWTYSTYYQYYTVVAVTWSNKGCTLPEE